MNSKAIYILPSNLFYPELINEKFKGVNKADILDLASNLYLNLLENLKGKENKIDIYSIWDPNIKDQLTDELKGTNCKYIFEDTSDLKILFEKLSTKEFLSYKNNLIVFSDIIDFKPSDYDQSFNLLNAEIDSILISKNKAGVIAVFGFNKYSDEIFSSLISTDFNYTNFLSKSKSCEHFMNIINDVLLVRDIGDFRQLYLELSQKKSMLYCSQQMHERFTHLFVEYKDLLK